MDQLVDRDLADCQVFGYGGHFAPLMEHMGGGGPNYFSLMMKKVL